MIEKINSGETVKNPARLLSGLIAALEIADPYLDKLAKDLGPRADKIKTLIRAIN